MKILPLVPHRPLAGLRAVGRVDVLRGILPAVAGHVLAQPTDELVNAKSVDAVDPALAYLVAQPQYVAAASAVMDAAVVRHSDGHLAVTLKDFTVDREDGQGRHGAINPQAVSR